VLEERVAELKEALRVQAKEGEASRTALNARAQELEQALSQAREDRDRAQARGVTAADRLAETREELASLKSARAATEKPDPRFPDLEPIQTLLGERARSTLGHRRRARNHPGTSTAGDLEQPLAESSSDEVGTASRTTGPIADSASLVKEEWMAQPPVWEARSARLSGPLEREASPPHDPADPSFEPEYDGRRAAEEPDAAPQGSWLRGLAQRIRGG
jgi:hypothetical protein